MEHSFPVPQYRKGPVAASPPHRSDGGRPTPTPTRWVQGRSRVSCYRRPACAGGKAPQHRLLTAAELRFPGEGSEGEVMCAPCIIALVTADGKCIPAVLKEHDAVSVLRVVWPSWAPSPYSLQVRCSSARSFCCVGCPLSVQDLRSSRPIMQLNELRSKVLVELTTETVLHLLPTRHDFITADVFLPPCSFCAG